MGFIFRVEDKHGVGPYHSKEISCWMHQDHYDGKHPGPDDDSMLTKRHRYDTYYGCSTINQLLTWFHIEELREFIEAGLRVMLYWVPSAIYTNHQAATTHIPTLGRCIPWPVVIQQYKLNQL